MMDLFGDLLGGIFGCPQNESFIQGGYSDVVNKDLNEYFNTFNCACNQPEIAICPIHPKQAPSESSGFVIDGECEDITNKRALPKIGG
jgi:hypothetical protein